MSKPKVGDKYACVWEYDDGTKNAYSDCLLFRQ